METDERLIAYVTNILLDLSYESAYRKAYGIPDGKSVGNKPYEIRQTEEFRAVHTRLTMDIQEAELTLKDHLEKLAELRDEAHANGKFAAAVQAEVARGKAAGLYTIRHEHSVNNVEQLTEDEIRKRLLAIQKTKALSPTALIESQAIDAEYNDVS